MVKALAALGDEPFFHVNSDTIWIDGARPNLERLAEAFDPARMDGLLLLAPATTSIGYSGRGDFTMATDGRLDAARRARRRAVRLCRRRDPARRSCSTTRRPGAFPLTALFNRAVEAGRLFGLRLEGVWMHVGTPEAIKAEAEDAIAASAALKPAGLINSSAYLCTTGPERIARMPGMTQCIRHDSTLTTDHASSLFRPPRRSCRR